MENDPLKRLPPTCGPVGDLETIAIRRMHALQRKLPPELTAEFEQALHAVDEALYAGRAARTKLRAAWVDHVAELVSNK